MYNEADLARVETCIEHIDAIADYTKDILVAEDLLKPINHIVMDASLMRLQAIGELWKTLTQKHDTFTADLGYSQLNNVIRFRDFISHHYDRVGQVDILHLIREHLPVLRSKLHSFLHQLP